MQNSVPGVLFLCLCARICWAQSADTCEVFTRQIFPLGGPLDGGTTVTVTGAEFHDHGDMKCRFGQSEVQALFVNDTLLKCVSPMCSESTCLTGGTVVGLGVPLEVSMNGVTFTGTGLQYHFYDMARIYVSHLTPSGGPRGGGTALTVSGSGFRDMSSGVSLVRMQGLMCKLGSLDSVNGTLVDENSLLCDAPDATALGGGELSPIPLELTFNGDVGAGSLTAYGVSYHHYDPAALNISRVHPTGGPSSGGTNLSLYLTSPTLLVDLGGSAPGLACRFSYDEDTGKLAHASTVRRHEISPAQIVSCRHARACGYGGDALSCLVPPYVGPLSAATDGADVTVEITLNGVDYTDSGVAYRYYDETVWQVCTHPPNVVMSPRLRPIATATPPHGA